MGRKSLIIFSVLFGVLAFATAVTSKKQNISGDLACNTSDMSGLFDYTNQTAIYEGEKIAAPLFARDMSEQEYAVLGVSASAERWIEIDLSEQKVKAWDGNNLYLESSISSGLPGTPTPVGEFRIWAKLRYVKMEGGVGRYYYNLPNVPYTMFFSNDKVPSWKGYGLHGTYWHNDFGNRRSHGCVNLPTPVAGKLYDWVGPNLSEGKRSVYASNDNPGTRIVIHE